MCSIVIIQEKELRSAPAKPKSLVPPTAKLGTNSQKLKKQGGSADRTPTPTQQAHIKKIKSQNSDEEKEKKKEIRLQRQILFDELEEVQERLEIFKADAKADEKRRRAEAEAKAEEKRRRAKAEEKERRRAEEVARQKVKLEPIVKTEPVTDPFGSSDDDSSDDEHVVVKIIADDDDETVECMGQSHNRRCQKSPSITARYRAKTF